MLQLVIIGVITNTELQAERTRTQSLNFAVISGVRLSLRSVPRAALDSWSSITKTFGTLLHLLPQNLFSLLASAEMLDHMRTASGLTLLFLLVVLWQSRWKISVGMLIPAPTPPLLLSPVLTLHSSLPL